MATCAHSSFKKGQPVCVLFKDGVRVFDEFASNASKFVIFKKMGRVQKKHIRQIVVDRTKHLRALKNC